MRGNLRVFCVQHPSLFFDYWEKKKSPQDLVQSRWLLFFLILHLQNMRPSGKKSRHSKKRGMFGIHLSDGMFGSLLSPFSTHTFWKSSHCGDSWRRVYRGGRQVNLSASWKIWWKHPEKPPDEAKVEVKEKDVRDTTVGNFIANL